MDEWPVLFPNKVHVCEHAGAGVAPWNIEWYQDYELDNTVFCRMTNQRVPIVFFHFQHLKYIKRKLVDTSIMKTPYVDKATVEEIYMPYLEKIEKCKSFLSERFGVDLMIRHHPIETGNRLKIFLKRFKFTWWLYGKLKHETPFIIKL